MTFRSTCRHATLVLLLAVRGIPALLLLRSEATLRETVSAGLLQATSLSFVVVATAIGVSLGQASTLANSGVIVAPTVLSVAAGSGGAVVGNTGTLNGVIALTGTGGNSLNNAGTITVTTPLSAGGGVTHVVDGTFSQTASGVFVTRLSPNNAAGNYDTLRVASTFGLRNAASCGRWCTAAGRTRRLAESCPKF